MEAVIQRLRMAEAYLNDGNVANAIAQVIVAVHALNQLVEHHAEFLRID